MWANRVYSQGAREAWAADEYKPETTNKQGMAKMENFLWHALAGITGFEILQWLVM